MKLVPPSGVLTMTATKLCELYARIMELDATGRITPRRADELYERWCIWAKAKYGPKLYHEFVALTENPYN